MPMDIKKIVEYMVKALVQNPDQVLITEKKDNARILFEIHVDQGDLGRVIGKNGRTIKSIRSIAGLVSKERNIYVDVAK
ncbi:KH domain-containing protein [Candidatus Dependentiae bacterium]